MGIFSGFSLNVVISGTEIKFEPDPSGFEVSCFPHYMYCTHPLSLTHTQGVSN